MLVVDDDRDLLDTYADIITLAGYQVEKAYDGKEAVLKYQQLRPSLVIMDITMPTMDGFDAFFKIKELDSNAKIILISGNAIDDERHIEAKKKTLLLLVTKPISIEFLTELIKRYS